MANLTKAFERADAFDWIRLDELLGQSAHGRFWREVLWEARRALREDNCVKYFLFWSNGYDGDRMETFETAAELAAWEQKHPGVEISMVIHGMEINRVAVS